VLIASNYIRSNQKGYPKSGKRFRADFGLFAVIREGSKSKEGARRAYEAIAPAYDAFTAHHDYEAWTASLLEVLREHGLRGNRLLDVGCGTGKSFLPMIPRGWRVTACDVSPAMVAIAREKVGPEVQVAVADMRQLPRFGEFDLVWALDDAVNYLLDDAELEAALVGMRANLAGGGRLLFDLNTLLAYRTFFAEEAELEREGRRMLWQGMTSPEATAGVLAEARFEAAPSAGSGLPAIPPETHRERHFPEATVLAALEAAGLDCLAVYGQHEDGVPRQPLDEGRHFKAIYVAAHKP
jgi:SAM-dependent methyltransferase